MAYPQFPPTLTVMIVVTGATGHLGGAVVEHLLARVPTDHLVASVRDPEGAGDLARRGVEVRRGDFAEPGTLAAAFDGADQVLVVSVDKLGDEARRLHRNAIEAARTAGVRRVLYTSHMGVRSDSLFAPAADHAAAEAVLAEDGGAYTALRHGYYAESALHHLGQGIANGEIRAPEDGPVSWTARADLAEADAVILADEGRFDGPTPPLTAPEAFTFADLAAVASEITGREVKRVVLADDEWVAERVAQGVPEPLARMLLGSYQASRRGDFAAVDPTLETLLGRRPRTMRDVLADVLEPPASEGVG